MTVPIAVVEADARALRRRRAELATFERSFSYPLGRDRFRIDHGADYLAFFEGLGTPSVWTAEVDGRIAGLLVAVRRALPEPVWYLCDLKVARGATGAGRALLETFGRTLRAGEPVFGVSMDPATGENRSARIALRCPRVGLGVGARLSIWSFEASTWRAVEPDFAARFGPLSFRDPAGEKDLVLEGTGRRMPLLHLQHGPFARPNARAPRDGDVLMACTPAEDPLTGGLARRGFVPSGTASVLCSGMDGFDWSSLLTSDI